MKDMYIGKLSDGMKNTLYGKIFLELSVNSGLLLKGEHLVVPSTLVEQLLKLGHQSHALGTNKTIRYCSR